jgi:hypothetical protein
MSVREHAAPASAGWQEKAAVTNCETGTRPLLERRLTQCSETQILLLQSEAAASAPY